MVRSIVRLLGLFSALSAVAVAAEPDLPEFDFHGRGAEGWQERHDVDSVTNGDEGLRLALGGDDPYVVGPTRDYPPGVPLVLHARVRADQPGTWQVFFFDRQASEAHSVRFSGRAGDWSEVRVMLPPLGPGYRLRIDPPGRRGTCSIASLRFARRLTIAAPDWPRPTLPQPEPDAPRVQSGELELRHAKSEWGGFTIGVAGELAATGHNRPQVGYRQGGREVWIDVAKTAQVTAVQQGSSLLVTARFDDQQAAHWNWQQRYSPAAAGTIDVETTVTTSRDREVFWLPMLLVLPGLGTFGGEKTQGLFAGLEYLENEPSSSTADVEGPAALRRVPNVLKVTFPLMAVAHRQRYVGLGWEPAPELGALFDSPDRLLQSGAHALGLLAPGSDGGNRADGEPFPHEPLALRADRPLRAGATIFGGRGASVVPAVQQFIARRGWPELPPRPPLADYVRLAAAGWLDSPLRRGSLFRHAVAGDHFQPQPAADAAWMARWLATLADESALSGRLRAVAAEAIAAVPPPSHYHAAVGHVRYPLAPLVYGQVFESVEQARQVARSLLGRFESDGAVRYRAPAQGLDFGRTQPSRQASGLAGEVVARALAAAAFCGDRELIDAALGRLRGLERFAGGVPRGAQTWEVPLHTPDILAAAHLVYAYTLGYELTGDERLLNEARYWAWTGVPFVYLRAPNDSPVGPYATIPVFGATHWTSVAWFGLPVQWCGLVYADALHQLARYDAGGPWRRLADGIAASGIQQTYPLEHPHRGLLPDSFNLASQSRNPADINPGTLQPLALRLLGRGAAYEFRALRESGLLVHAPGTIDLARDADSGATWSVRSWVDGPYWVLIHGAGAGAKLSLDGRPTPLTAPHEHRASSGTLVLRLEGPATIALGR